MPTDVPDPLSLPTFKERWKEWADLLGDWYDRDRPIDSRNGDWSPLDRSTRCRPASACGSAPTACSPTTRCCTPAS